MPDAASLRPILVNRRDMLAELDRARKSDEIWKRLCDEYDARCDSSSFLDYFWTVRTMHRPLFTLAARYPHSRCPSLAPAWLPMASIDTPAIRSTPGCCSTEPARCW